MEEEAGVLEGEEREDIGDRVLVHPQSRGADQHELGEIVGRRETIALGFQANEHPPALRAFDRAGRRIDEVEYHPAWHSLLALGVEHGLHALPWKEPRPGAHVARAAMFMLV